MKSIAFKIHGGKLTVSVQQILFLIFLCMVLSCKQNTGMKKKEFVRVEGTRFMIGDTPYYYIGTNLWQGAYLGANLIPGGRERLKRELDLLKSYGITNLRIMASAEASSLQMSVRPAFVLEPGVYNDTLLIGLDYLLDQMGKRNMRAVLCLNNYWQWSGGMAQYMNWATGDSIIDPDASGNWHGFMEFSAKFYQNHDAQAMFFNYLKMLLKRVNSFNGVPYNDDPTIMTWELANEPRPDPLSLEDSSLYGYFYKWIDSTARLIHSLAPRQLVTTGNEGLAGSLFNEYCFRHMHSFPSIDYITIHIWPKNWGWYDAKDPGKTFEPTIHNFFDYIGKHIDIARELNKPMVLEEFGFERDSGDFAKTSPVHYRNKFYDIVFRTMTDSAFNGSPLVGANFWAWGGEGSAVNPEYKWEPNTDYTGDPPQEPQGLNSIFASDTSTLNIIKKYTRKLATIK